MTADPPLRIAKVALGLRSTAQCLGRIGAQAGVFLENGVDLRVAAFETAAPLALAGLMDGRWEFAEMGAVPVVQGVLDGLDPVILLAPEPVNAMFVMARDDIRDPAALDGGRLGVLSASGQTAVTAAAILARWGLEGRVDLEPLGTYPAIFQAIVRREIEAGLLTADYRFAGEAAHGMTPLVNLGDEFGFQGPVVATTRRLVARDRDLARRVVQGYAASIRRFKTDRARFLPLLADHLGFEDAATVAAAYEFYRPRFRDPPLPSFEGIQRIIDTYRETRLDAAHLTSAELCDLTLLEEIESS